MKSITDVQIQPIHPKDGLIAFASLVLDEAIYLGSIGVYSRIDGRGIRLSYPSRKIGDKNLHVYHPINKGIADAICGAVEQKLVELGLS